MINNTNFMTDQALMYILVLVMTAIILLLIGVVVSYLRLMRKYVDLREGRDKEIDPQTIIVRANARAQRILDDAQFQARELITKAQAFLNSNEGVVAKELQNANQIYAKKFEESLLQTQGQVVKTVQTIPDDIKKVLLNEITGIRSLMQQEVNTAAENAKQMVTEAYKKAEAEVDGYKKERLRQVDESIVMILKEVARKVLAKEISQEEHEKLVLKALEEAKQENVFLSEVNSNGKNINNTHTEI